MPSPEVFLPIEKKPERAPSAMELLRQELRGDLDAFPEDVQSFVHRYAQGESLPGHQQGQLDRAINVWWHDKYGFPYRLKQARDEVLLRKHLPPEDVRRRRDLQREFFTSVASGNRDRIAEVKERYLKEYPDQLEAVEALFGIREVLRMQKSLDRKRERGEVHKDRKVFQDLTEYQFLFTHFLASNSEDKQMLEQFWIVVERAAKEMDQLPDLNRLRRGILSQVATVRLLEALGLQPQLSHPEQDAFDAIDLWAAGGTAVQVKGSAEAMQPAFIESDELAFPSIATRHRAEHRHFNSKLAHDSARFRAKLKQYAERTRQELRGYLLVIPNEKIDFVTGEPAPELIEFFRREFDRKGIGAEEPPAALRDAA